VPSGQIARPALKLAASLAGFGSGPELGWPHELGVFGLAAEMHLFWWWRWCWLHGSGLMAWMINKRSYCITEPGAPKDQPNGGTGSRRGFVECKRPSRLGGRARAALTSRLRCCAASEVREGESEVRQVTPPRGRVSERRLAGGLCGRQSRAAKRPRVRIAEAQPPLPPSTVGRGP